MNINFNEIEIFLANSEKNALFGFVRETKFWRVEIVKHCRTGLFTIAKRNSTVRPSKIRQQYKRGLITLAKIDSHYIEGDEFSVFRIPVPDEEAAFDACYTIAEHYRGDPRFAANPDSEFFFRDLPEELQNILDGALAGDGCYRNQKGHYLFTYSISTKYRGHVEVMQEELARFGCVNPVRDYISRSRDGKEILFSCVNWSKRCFKKHHARWYKEGRLKQLPNDVKNTPTFWRWFYAGDGCLSTTSSKKLYIRIFPYDFEKHDVEKMVNMLSELGVKASFIRGRMNADKTRELYEIWIQPKEVPNFLEMIGPPIRGIEYKWRT